MEHNERSRRLPRDIVIDGEHWPTFFTAEQIRSAKLLRPRPDDVIICTYAKSGTTLTQHIVHQLMGQTEYERIGDANSGAQQTQARALCYASPMIEQVGADFVNAMDSPRIFKSHFKYQDIPKGGGAKYIYVVRNPKDCLTSYFHHHRNFKHYDFEDGDFNVFFDLFMDGNVGCGNYFDHLLSWLEGVQKKEENILLIKYEDMVSDLHAAVLAVATFIGGDKLVCNEREHARIVEASTLQAMKKNQQRWLPDKTHHGEFIRKGGSGDWRNHFSHEQSVRIDECFRQRFTGTVAAEWWSAEMVWNARYYPRGASGCKRLVVIE